MPTLVGAAVGTRSGQTDEMAFAALEIKVGKPHPRHQLVPSLLSLPSRETKGAAFTLLS